MIKLSVQVQKETNHSAVALKTLYLICFFWEMLLMLQLTGTGEVESVPAKQRNVISTTWCSLKLRQAKQPHHNAAFPFVPDVNTAPCTVAASLLRITLSLS